MMISQQNAIEAVLNFTANGNGSLPATATRHLRSIGADLSRDVSSVWLGDADDTRRINFPCKRRTALPSSSPTETAVL